jgi:phospholipid-binding lipoprotein MlaA
VRLNLILHKAVIFSACFAASLAGDPARAEPEQPLDRFNLWAHEVNRSFVDHAVKPVIDGVASLPAPVRTSLGNAFSNLSEPVSALSHLMAGDGSAATQTTARFAVNSTAGLLGLFDVATPMGLAKNKRHFSEGVCALGLATPDSYVVVPGIGPSTLGIAGSAVFVMVGSTVVLAFVSTELAVASVMADLAGSAAALENAASSAGKADNRHADEKSFRATLSSIGC